MQSMYLRPLFKPVILAVLGILLSLGSFAQNRPYFPFFQQEYFFGIHPNARVEAMGRADVAMGGSALSTIYNPAGLGGIETWDGSFGTAGPYYALQNSDYIFLGYAQRFKGKWVGSINVNQFYTGPTNFRVNIAGERFDLDRPVTSDWTLSVAREIIPGLYVGANAHLFNWRLFRLSNVPSANAFYADLGAFYETKKGDRIIRAGASIVNLTGTEISFQSPINTESSNFFPIIMRAGAAYGNTSQIPFPGAGQQSLRWIVTVEYQDVLNNDFRSSFRLGGEAVLAEVLALRLGFITQSEDDMGISTNRSRFNDLTYGFGVIIPTHKWFGGAPPFDVHIDYFALENPPLTTSGRRFPNRRGFTIRLVGYIASN